MDESIGFLFRKQLAEADLLCLTKVDRYPSRPGLPVAVDFEVSAVTGQGIDEWLDTIRSGSRLAGARLLDVDYSRYAEAEAALRCERAGRCGTAPTGVSGDAGRAPD